MSDEADLMAFEEKKTQIIECKPNPRSSGASLMSEIALTEEGESYSDTSSDEAGTTWTVESLLKGSRRKSQSDQKFWPSRRHHRTSRKFMMLPKTIER